MSMQRSFDIADYVTRVKAGLEEMRRSQQPGQAARGGKTDVIHAAKAEILEALREGYTAQQIALAIRSAAFPVQPKTITELVGSGTKKRKPASPRVVSSTPTTGASPGVFDPGEAEV